MGWETHVKLIFFAPMTVCLLVSLVTAFLIMCNMSTPQLRKQSMAIDHDSVCYGYVYFSIYFVVTWMAGMLAYVRLEALQNLPTFYPLFQVSPTRLLPALSREQLFILSSFVSVVLTPGA